MSNEQIRNTVLSVLREVAPEAEASGIDPDLSFHDQLEIDSIDFLSLVMGLEKALQMTISEMDYPALSTLNGCEAYFIRRLVA